MKLPGADRVRSGASRLGPLFLAALFLLPACRDGEDTSGPTGSVEVTVTTTGEDPDPDGYRTTLDGSSGRFVAIDGTVRFPDVAEGDHQVALAGIADNCAVEGANPRTVTVAAGATASTSFSVACTRVARVAFRSDRTGDSEVWVVRPDGTDPRNRTQDPASDRTPRWSPDGSKLAFVSDPTGDSEIRVMAAPVSNPTNLTLDGGVDSDPRWSPDGSRLAFVSDRSGDAEIWVMAADGSNPTNLTLDGGVDSDPRWSPDGSKLAFVSDRSGDSEI